jgi:hypothetical protein
MTKEDNLREYGLVLGDVDDGLEEDPKPRTCFGLHVYYHIK